MNTSSAQITIVDVTGEHAVESYMDTRDTDQKIRDAVEVIKGKLVEGHSMLCATSMGKDSSVLTMITLRALRECVEENGSAPFVVFATSNTLVENPVMDQYARGEAAKVRAYIAKHNLPARMDIVTPSLSNHYYLQLIAGRTVATLPGNGAKCSMMLKVLPLNKHKKRVFAELGSDKPVITLIGKRFDESAERGRTMAANGENAMDAIEDSQGSLVLSAISDFTLDDVMYTIGMVRSGRMETYSNFDELVEIYRAGNSGDCMINIYATGAAGSTGCGARYGCFVCARTSADKSMENMLKEDEYVWMRGLNKIRNWLVADHYNPDTRTWLSRSVQEDGTIVIAPNSYSPQKCEDLLRYTLTVQIEEQEAAARMGIEPRFFLIGPQETLYLDLAWNRYGYHRSLKACEIYQEVYEQGQRFYPPEDPIEYTRSALPEVGTRVQFEDGHYDAPMSGFRDLESAVADCERLVEKNGVQYVDANVATEMRIDAEGADMFFAFEIDYALDRFADDYVAPAAGFHYLVRLGVVELSKGSHSENDRMLRMANAIWRLGLRDHLSDPLALVEKLEAHFGSGKSTGGNYQHGLFAA